MEEELVKEFLRARTFAVVGASKNPEKYGHQIYRDLKGAGYRVYPVNPKADEIDGDKCYHSLKDLPERPDVVDVVVPPRITERVVEECEREGIDRVWMQPGSESEKAIGFCEENDIKVLHGICVMMKRRSL